MPAKLTALSLVLFTSLSARAADYPLLDDAFADLYNFNFPAAHSVVDR